MIQTLPPDSQQLQPGQIRLFFGLIGGYFLLTVLLLLAYGYEGSFLVLNGAHNAFLDALIPHVSNLGDSLILASIVTLIAWQRDPALAITGILVVAVAGILAQVLKRNLFSDWDRPLEVFGHQGIGIHSFPHEQLKRHSFPSGHSTTAIAGFTVLAYHYRTYHQFFQGVMAALAILVCHARVYMGVHFPGDVLAGGVIALTCTVVAVRWVYPGLRHWLLWKPRDWHQNARWIMLPLAGICLVVGLILRYRHLVG